MLKGFEIIKHYSIGNFMSQEDTCRPREPTFTSLVTVLSFSSEVRGQRYRIAL